MKNTYHRAHGNARTFLRLRDKEEACTPITGGLLFLKDFSREVPGDLILWDVRFVGRRNDEACAWRYGE
jgi:hypothetical protein